MKLGLLEKSRFNSAVKRLNTQLRDARAKGWEGLAEEIENFLLPYQTTDSGYLSQSTKYYDKYDIDRIMKYSRGEYYITTHKEELKENFGDLSDEELKEYSASLSEYKEKFNEYISVYYLILMDEFGDVLNAPEKLSYRDIYQMVDFIDNLKAGKGGNTKRNVTFEEWLHAYLYRK